MAEDLFSSNHTLHPPQTDEDLLSWLRLIRSRRVGVTTFFRLLREHKTADAALVALPEVARNAGVKDYEVCPKNVAITEMSLAKKLGVRMICYGTPDYPATLMDITDAPPIVWVRGDTTLLSNPMIALVSARNASSLGTRMARKLAAELGEAGFVVVSGLARGIDTASHLAALPSGTVAVFGGGVDVIYPQENAALADEICKTGLCLSEQPMGMQPQARHFPARNRIISGLSSAVVVVEAALKSGSLITARNALDQGREVLAVPGHPIDARASGCNALIREGATLVRSAEDVIEAISRSHTANNQPPEPQPVAKKKLPKRSLREISKLHTEILSRLGPSPIAEDQLIRDLALPAKAINPEITTLEMEGRIERRAGGLLSIVR